ncbi:Sphingosine N-acyltransferase lac1; AltName: Full=Meiotically up-regulated gene 83 protein [Serendipita indica DSM 11827]|nr:Sphingosine N-acyltransferase lac1; AltName: Full=Meiotically up-regulated gene 83 protein [Serendipita indica DSM 11827]
MSYQDGQAIRRRPGYFQRTLRDNGSDTDAPDAPKANEENEPVLQAIWRVLFGIDWMYNPSAALRIMLSPIVFYMLRTSFVPPHLNKQYPSIFLPSNRIEDSPQGFRQYAKSYWDIAFVAYYVVVFACIRQTLFNYILKPMARRYGIRKEKKVDRFAEQTYSILYFCISSPFGLYTMYKYMPTWYYQTKNFWINYPHWQLPGTLKYYYLVQAAYWTHQFLVLALKLEKPRSDYAQLVAHHVVTLWLIFWSYTTNLTFIGNAVFITMDVSDIFLSTSLTFNYLKMQKTKTAFFALLFGVWTYTRHYLNLRILWSIWHEFDLIPRESQVWKPEEGSWMVSW